MRHSVCGPAAQPRFQSCGVQFLGLGYYTKLEMWANAQRDGRPAEYRWRPLFNATKFG